MSTPVPGGRAALVTRLQDELVQAVADGILLQQAVADRLGLSLGDFKCLTVLGETGHATAGDIATRTGLTTGAVTRMIDRLERAGWVVREHDLTDRRRVIVRPVPERQAEILPLFQGMSAGWAEALADYPDEQIALVLDLFERMREVAREQAALIRDQATSGRGRDPSP
ncbi:MarR family winged helix-turn-helix transcriptional regulator [Actinocrispum wychmicini]|uniref:DNA-binding MarR family transcriptional regulator n=1 Tax=Actinocrispum wychmicini TaxID=1213861 RepID=A0A4R2JV20_9PSEU|nr:MarR family transcriptional regulator [Actinocrispum wychmicini]TCO60889.1 DNA-binding MarR family transcriptional regulator [Actinocrispum wychmicini]